MATVKKIKKAQDGKIQKPKKPTPTYKNLRMGVNNQNYLMSGENRNITPSSKDSDIYRGGFEQGLKGMKGMPNEGQIEKMGRWEGQNAAKKSGAVKKTMKTGGTLTPSKKSVGKTIGKLNKAKMGGKISKKK